MKYFKLISSLVLFVLLEGSLLWLADWQYTRMLEKRQLMTEIKTQSSSFSNLEIRSSLPSKNKISEWKALRLLGVFDYSREKLLENRYFETYKGYRLLTPLVLTGGQEVLVDRGWIPEKYTSLNDYRTFAPVEIVGVVRYDHKKRKHSSFIPRVVEGSLKNSVMLVDIASFSVLNPKTNKNNGVDANIKTLKAVDLANYYLQATQPHNKNIKAFMEKPHMTPEKHQGYMWTWALLAGLLPLMYAWALWSYKRRA